MRRSFASWTGSASAPLALGLALAAAGCGALEVDRGYRDERAGLERRPSGLGTLDRAPASFGREPASEPATEAALAASPTAAFVVETALRRNPDVAAALERWQAATERIPQATSYPDPSASYTHSDVMRLDTWQVMQAIPFPGKLTAQGRAALALSRAAHEDYEERRNELRAAAASALFELFFRRKELAVIRENLVLLGHFVEISRALYAAGKAREQDVLKAEVERSNLRAAEALSARRVDVALAGLNALLDRTPRAPVGDVTEPAAVEAKLDRGALYARALERRPELLASLERAGAADAGLTRAKLEYLPDFVVGGAWQRQTRTDLDGPLGMVGITLPLWWGKISSGVAEAEANARRSRREVEASRDRVLREVEEAAALTEAAADRAKIFQSESLPQARQAMQAAEADYEAGRIEFLSLIDAERLLLRAELDRFRAVADFGERNAELERAVGAVLELPR